MRQRFTKIFKISTIFFMVGFLFFTNNIFFKIENAFAGSCSSTGSTAWATGSTWTAGCTGASGIPAAGDNVTILNTHNVTIATGVAAVATDITVNNGGTLTITSTGGLTASGNFINNGTITGTGTLTLTGNGTTIDGTGAMTGLTGTFTLTNNKTINSTANLTVGSSTSAAAISAATTITNNGSFAFGGTGAVTGGNATTTIWLQNSSTAVLKIASSAANFLATGVLTATTAGNTVVYTTGIQTIKLTTYHNLTIQGTTKTFPTGATTINGVYSIENGTSSNTYTGTITYGASATLQYNAGSSARTAVVAEWPATFTATGGVIIAGTGAISTGGAKVFGSNTNVPFTMQSGSKLTPSTNSLTFNGDYINNGGTWTAAATPVVITGTVATQAIAGFTTTGAVSMTKTSGTATFGGNVSGAGLTINGSGGTLNLGTGLTHTFTGAIALTAGTLNGGSSTLNANGATTTCWTGTGSVFSAGTGTVVFGNAAQTIAASTAVFNNVKLAGSGAKTFSNANTINGTLEMAGTATATLTGALTYGANAILKYSSTHTTGAEWASPTPAGQLGGGIIITAGTVTLNAAKVVSSGTTLTLSLGASLAMSTFLLTLNDDFINNNPTIVGPSTNSNTSGSGGVTITGSKISQNIGSFDNSGTVTMSKSAGTATMNGHIGYSVVPSSLVINGSGGTLSLGTGAFYATFGTITLTSGTLKGGNAKIELNAVSATAWAGTGSLFTAETSTVDFLAAGNQTHSATATTFYNLILEGSGTKTLTNISSITNNLTMNTSTPGTTTTTYTTPGSLTIGGNLNIGAGSTLTTGATNTWTLSVGGVTSVRGTLTLNNNANKSFTGLVNVETGGAMTVAAGATVTYKGGLQNSSAGTVTVAAPTTFSTNNQSISGQSGFVALSQSAQGTSWYDLAINPSTHDVYAAMSGSSNIYKQTAGSGNFGIAYAATSTTRSVSINPNNGDVYSAVFGGDIYKYNGSYNAIAGSIGPKYYRGVAYNAFNSKLYATIDQDSIYTSDNGGTGTLTSLGTSDPSTNNGWRDIDVNNNTGDVYATTYGGGIWVQTAGSGAFTQLSTTIAPLNTWYGISIDDTTGDVYAVSYNDGIYKRTGGTGNFVPIGSAISGLLSVGVDSGNQYVYAGNNLTTNGDVYKMTGTSYSPITFSSTVTVSGAVTVTNNDQALVTITGALNGDNAGSAWTQGASSLLSLGSATVPFNTNGVLNASASGNTVTYTAAAAAIDNATYNNLTITGAGSTIGGATVVNGTMTVSNTVTNNSTLTVTTALSGASTLTNSATGVLNLGGTVGITGLTATASGNVVNYTGANQAIKVVSYDDLTLSGSGTATGAVTTVTGDLTLSGSVSWAQDAITSTMTSVTMNSSGTLTLGANMVTSGALTLTQGTFDAANFTVSAASFASSNSNTRVLNMGTNTWSLTGTGTVWDAATSTGLTVNPGTSTIKITDSSTTNKTFAGGGKTYNNIWLSAGYGQSAFTFSGDNTFNDFKGDAATPYRITFTAGSTTTVTTWTVSGHLGNNVVLQSTTTDTYNLVKSGGGTIESDYLDIYHSVATPSSTWYAGANSTNHNSVATAGSGWIFTVGPKDITINGAATTCTGSPNFVATTSCNILNTDIQTLLNQGTDVSFTATGNITVSNAFTKSAGANATMSMYANKNIIVNASITSSSGTLGMLLNSDRDADSSGYIDIEAALTSNGGNITLGGGSGTISAGTGFANGNSVQVIGVKINNVAVAAGAGNIIINGQGLNSSSGGYGTYITGASGAITTIGSGNINITSNAGSGTSGANHGFYAITNPTISAVNGNITITGTGGAATSNDNNHGVHLETGALVTTTGSGNINITGTGGSTSGLSGSNIGFYCSSTVTCVNATSTGSVSITGTGGSGGTGSSNDGVFIYYPNINLINATGGAITINGTGGSSTGSTQEGAVIYGSVTNNGSGTISITGNGGSSSTSTSNNGLEIGQGSISTVNGNITIIGNGGGIGGAAQYSPGIATSTNANIKTTGSGNITVTGTANLNAANNYGVMINYANGLQTTGTGSITVNTDTINLNAANNINSIGSLTIAPYTASSTVGVAGGSGTLALSSTYLGYLTYGTGLTIGNAAQTGTTTVGAYASWAKPITFKTNASGAIAISGAQTNSSTFTFDGPTTLSAGITSSALTIASGTFNAGSQTINLSGDSGTLFTLSGGSFTAGTSTVLASYAYNTATFASGNPIFYNVHIDDISSVVKLGENLTVTNNINISGGRLNTQNYSVNSASLSIVGGGLLSAGSSTISLSGTGTVFSSGSSGNFIRGTSTIKLTDASSAGKIFAGGGDTYGNLWLAAGTGSGAYTITGSNTFADFKDDGTVAHSILFTAGTTTTVTTFTVSGNAGQLITINSGDGAGGTSTSTHTLSQATGTVNSDYLNIQHSIATGGATWNAGSHSTNNNSVATAGSGWIFPVVGCTSNTVSGNWNTAGTWSCGYVPTDTTATTIRSGDTITMDVNSASLGDLTINGTLNTSVSNYSLTSSTLTISGTGTLNANGSIITITGNGTAFSNSGTFNAGTSTIKLTDSTSNDKTFAGNGGTYKNILFTGTGTGAFIITGSNTFNRFSVDTPPHTVKFTAGTTQTVFDWNVSGIPGNLITLNSTANGTPWNLYFAPTNYGNGGYASDYLSLRDSVVTGNTYFSVAYAGSNSTNTSGNSGWTFSTRSYGGCSGPVESSANPDAGRGGGGSSGGGGIETNPEGTCVDGIQNGDEIGIDTGGRCAGQGGGGNNGGDTGDVGYLYNKGYHVASIQITSQVNYMLNSIVFMMNTIPLYSL